MAKRDPNRREFLQLAKTFKMGKNDPSGLLISEKLDGCRCFWDGGVSRGCPTDTVPWANIIDPKTGDRKKKIKPIASGLWSRYGNPIMAPDWFLNRLPVMFLDGELFAGRGNFQFCRSIISKDVPDDEAWRKIAFPIFGAPSINQVFRDGTIKNTNFHLDMSFGRATTFLANRCREIATDLMPIHQDTTFEGELNILQSALPNDELVYLHRHLFLPGDRNAAEKAMNAFLHEVLEEGGEGAILRDGGAIWTPKRVSALLKLKPFTDDAGIVTGFTSGRETSKGSKLRGLIGALILDYNGKRLELSGLTDEERIFLLDADAKWAWEHPGDEMPEGTQGRYFKFGDKVEFRYRELSDAGIPKEARFLRPV